MEHGAVVGGGDGGARGVQAETRDQSGLEGLKDGVPLTSLDFSHSLFVNCNKFYVGYFLFQINILMDRYCWFCDDSWDCSYCCFS